MGSLRTTINSQNTLSLRVPRRRSARLSGRRRRRQGAGRSRFGPIRFGSRLFSKIIVSVRLGLAISLSIWPALFESIMARSFRCIWPALFESVMARSGSVRFVSASGSGIKLFGSVWFGRFGSVSRSFLTEGFLSPAY